MCLFVLRPPWLAVFAQVWKMTSFPSYSPEPYSWEGAKSQPINKQPAVLSLLGLTSTSNIASSKCFGGENKTCLQKSLIQIVLEDLTAVGSQENWKKSLLEGDFSVATLFRLTWLTRTRTRIEEACAFPLSSWKPRGVWELITACVFWPLITLHYFNYLRIWLVSVFALGVSST